MPLHAFFHYLPSLDNFLSFPLIVSLITIYAIHILFRGSKTTRERDLHDRVIILTGVLSSSLALPLVEQLATRGAHIIALVDERIDIRGDGLKEIVEAIRERTKNEQVYVERVDMSSPTSIREFCAQFLKSEKRLDAIVFAHEYRTRFSLLGATATHEDGALATFYLSTLLIPSLLAAPTERDIRIVNVVNPFYAAAPTASSADKKVTTSTIQNEGIRSRRTIVWTYHLQQVFNALPSNEVPDPNRTSTTTSSQSGEVKAGKTKTSNISAISVNPGIAHSDTIYYLIGADRSWIRFLTYCLLYPLLLIFTRTPSSALQTILHVLFVPARFKVVENSKEECLVPGSLYADCKVVTVPGLSLREGETDNEEGREVWEELEKEVKTWVESEEKAEGKNEAGVSQS